MSKPLFVAISDIHFNINTLELASKSLQAALYKAEKLNIPLVIAGDLNDTKAIIRAEVANAIIRILKPAKVKVYILEGNHDKVNEKGSEHGLNYLRPYATIVDAPGSYPMRMSKEGHYSHWITMVPYMSDSSKFALDAWAIKGIYVMHQGFRGAFMGDYIQDKTSMSVDIVKDHTVISGHYHRHQTLATVTYIGSPYTVTFGEANDGPKGFLVVNEDGTFERQILELRKHIVVSRKINSDLEAPVENYQPGDIVKVKLTGPRGLLKLVDKQKLGLKLIGHSNFKLELIPEDTDEARTSHLDLTDHELMLQLIKDKQPSLEPIYMELLDEIGRN